MPLALLIGSMFMDLCLLKSKKQTNPLINNQNEFKWFELKFVVGRARACHSSAEPSERGGVEKRGPKVETLRALNRPPQVSHGWIKAINHMSDCLIINIENNHDCMYAP